ncbi:hypothetical protein DVA67_029385 [Solirubrobacter sp. CPCC 204708]|uniref:AttH domain-containing protein n=1 Tax=Solirubrobacter deserti TaxID=2282478 RepID=A0ABT4RMP5_9ACTN|nr:hypothetical protein [Solirubrobacter deserti]MBE2320115.1 hypothetical protein [Solirubrobacter deserti]MDA0139833.1 hypothetical protein [Solirubrobacter deserti]
MAGRYESWFVSARDTEPGRPVRALWIRHTRHHFTGADAGSAALWCTVFDPAGGGGPAAVKESVTAFGDDVTAGDDRFRGGARARGRMAEWDLTVTGAPELRHLRPGLLYRAPLPKTKLVAPVPDGIVSGRVVVDGVVVDVVGWRATIGHNWGREHAERWVWLHAAGFDDEPDAWLELALARVRVGGALSPWIANGAVFVAGRRFRLGGLGHVPGVRVVAAPGRLEAIVPGRGIELRVAAHADLDQTVAFTYTGPRQGDTRSVLHSGLASVRLGVRRPGRSSAELATTAGGAYELGARELPAHGVPLQPYPDP